MPKDSILTSSVASVEEADLDKMAGFELRTKLIGQIPGLEVNEHSGKAVNNTTNLGSAWFASANVTFKSKGWTSIACFVDGVPVPFSQFYLEPN